ncbi:hypothetical protein IAU60_005933 [Kwoniella sp. DSM 27419]
MPRPLFSSGTQSDRWVPPKLDINPDWEEEQHVESSLPSTPATYDEHEGHYAENDLSRGSPSWRGNTYGQASGQPESLQNDTEDTAPEQPTSRERDTSDPADDSSSESERSCRICFSGSEDEDVSGRMISPCLCTGSMRVPSQLDPSSRRLVLRSRPRLIAHPSQLPQRLAWDRYQRREEIMPSVSLPISAETHPLLHLLLHHSPYMSRALLSRSRTPTSMFDLFDDDPYYNGGSVIVVGGGGKVFWDIFTTSLRTFVDLANSFADSRSRLASALPGPVAGMVFELVVRFMLGLAVLGSMSFLSLLLSMSLLGPLQLAHGLRGAGFLGNWGRRRARADAGNNTSITTIMIVGVVIIGAVNTLLQVYSAVRAITGRLLRYVETQILEVNADEIHKQRKERERTRRANRWYVRWMREGRWKRREGWYEVYLRAKLGAQHWVERRHLGREHRAE